MDKECIDCGWPAEYVYNDEYYCESCLLEALGIETEEVTYYNTEDGRYLGNEQDDYMIDIFQEVDDTIQEL